MCKEGEWDELIREMVDYLCYLSPQELKELQGILNIVEYVTPFGVLRIRMPRLFKD